MTDAENPQNSLVSIIIPAYNAETTIKRCLNSVIEQSYKKIEIIVINDGSTDKTSDILAEYANLDARILVINIENNGFSHARNVGIKASKGSLSAVGCDIKGIVSMKTTLFAHYKALYESIDLYDENKLKINRFYIDFARDTVKSFKKLKDNQDLSEGHLI